MVIYTKSRSYIVTSNAINLGLRAAVNVIVMNAIKIRSILLQNALQSIMVIASWQKVL